MVLARGLNLPVARLHDLAALLDAVSSGQRRVAEALVADPYGHTYPELGAALGLHVGTVHRHLGRIKRRHPAVYAALMAIRAAQLNARHQRALARRRVKRWQRRYRHLHVYGCEPWER